MQRLRLVVLILRALEVLVDNLMLLFLLLVSALHRPTHLLRKDPLRRCDRLLFINHIIVLVMRHKYLSCMESSLLYLRGILLRALLHIDIPSYNQIFILCLFRELG